MSVHAADDPHVLVVAPEPAEVAERLGVPLHAGDRVRFEVIAGGLATTALPTTNHGHRPGSTRSSPTTSTSPNGRVTS